MAKWLSTTLWKFFNRDKLSYLIFFRFNFVNQRKPSTATMSNHVSFKILLPNQHHPLAAGKDGTLDLWTSRSPLQIYQTFHDTACNQRKYVLPGHKILSSHDVKVQACDSRCGV
ncbi:hypothetical protein TNCV_3744851 [Trichonephila clavipes]|nr:hypothetical protein TNCV_3744851 [Trichonephila clavipes]